jgi:cell wall-associated NlpC family hydrolase
MNNIDIINKAREYINTPFHHQGRLKGVGVDCAGLIICTAKDLNIDVYDIKGYSNIPSQGLFEKTVINQLIKIDFEDLQQGDMMIFKFTSEPQHIAFVSEVKPNIKIIHAYQQVNKVVEHDFDKIWERRLVACFRFKNLKD